VGKGSGGQPDRGGDQFSQAAEQSAERDPERNGHVAGSLVAGNRVTPAGLEAARRFFFKQRPPSMQDGPRASIVVHARLRKSLTENRLPSLSRFPLIGRLQLVRACRFLSAPAAESEPLRICRDS